MEHQERELEKGVIKMLRGLPKLVYVAIREELGEGAWLTCETSPTAAIEDDGPTKVGTYRLVGVDELRKEAVSTAKRRKHGTQPRQKQLPRNHRV
jgi:hypothetical protein